MILNANAQKGSLSFAARVSSSSVFGLKPTTGGTSVGAGR